EPMLSNMLRVNNFSSAEAERVLRECAAHDGLAFPDNLATAVVSDLSHNNEVRPAELQIVCTTLRAMGLTVQDYDKLDRSSGIIAAYVKGAVEESPDSQAAMVILRALCSFETETRSQSLADAELISLLSNSGRSPALASRVVAGLADAGLVVREID